MKPRSKTHSDDKLGAVAFLLIYLAFLVFFLDARAVSLLPF